MHPVIHICPDAPVYDENQTEQVIERFYDCIKSVDRNNFRKSLDGKENSERLKEYRKNFRDYCKDPNPEELESLAEIANGVFWMEWSFMYQGTPENVTLILPRWAITLEEEFAGNWSGSYHPLLQRGCNAGAYREEAFYIKHIRC